MVQKNAPIEKKIWVELAKKLLRICMALLRSGRSFDSLLIEKSEKRKVEKEAKKRARQLHFFKKQITKLRAQFNFKNTITLFVLISFDPEVDALYFLAQAVAFFAQRSVGLPRG